MSWVIAFFATVGFLSLVGTAGVLFAAWSFRDQTDEDAKRPDDIDGGAI